MSSRDISTAGIIVGLALAGAAALVGLAAGPAPLPAGPELRAQAVGFDELAHRVFGNDADGNARTPHKETLQ